MTDQAIDAQPEELAKRPRKGLSGKKLVLFIILPLLLVGGGAGAYLSGVFKSAPKPEATTQQAKPSVFFNVPDMLVNLNSDARHAHFLKLSIAFELGDSNEIPKLQAVMPRIIDSFQVYLRQLRVDDLSGAAGIQRLREELIIRADSAIQPLQIKDVLFKEMLVQ